MPNSSLAHYLSLVFKAFASQGSDYFIDDTGLQVDRIFEELESREAEGQPYALLGASFSFVHLFEALEKNNRTFSLPKGSKLLDTGGYKNQSAELDAETFYQKMHDYLGVERHNCINMFGMTELSTAVQRWQPSTSSDNFRPTLVENTRGQSVTGEDLPEGGRKGCSCKLI